jgi:hypothetical protein
MWFNDLPPHEIPLGKRDLLSTRCPLARPIDYGPQTVLGGAFLTTCGGKPFPLPLTC